ncbi:MAG: hypothetical protein AB7S26_11595 [Sandaracinaceae bacterium]
MQRTPHLHLTTLLAALVLAGCGLLLPAPDRPPPRSELSPESALVRIGRVSAMRALLRAPDESPETLQAELDDAPADERPAILERLVRARIARLERAYADREPLERRVAEAEDALADARRASEERRWRERERAHARERRESDERAEDDAAWDDAPAVPSSDRASDRERGWDDQHDDEDLWDESDDRQRDSREDGADDDGWDDADGDEVWDEEDGEHEDGEDGGDEGGDDEDGDDGWDDAEGGEHDDWGDDDADDGWDDEDDGWDDRVASTHGARWKHKEANARLTAAQRRAIERRRQRNLHAARGGRVERRERRARPSRRAARRTRRARHTASAVRRTRHVERPSPVEPDDDAARDDADDVQEPIADASAESDPRLARLAMRSIEARRELASAHRALGAEHRALVQLARRFADADLSDALRAELEFSQLWAAWRARHPSALALSERFTTRFASAGDLVAVAWMIRGELAYGERLTDESLTAFRFGMNRIGEPIYAYALWRTAAVQRERGEELEARESLLAVEREACDRDAVEVVRLIAFDAAAELGHGVREDERGVLLPAVCPERREDEGWHPRE